MELVFSEGYDAGDEGAATVAGGLDLQGAPDEAGAVIHDAQAHPGGAAFQIGERQAIILNG